MAAKVVLKPASKPVKSTKANPTPGKPGKLAVAKPVAKSVRAATAKPTKAAPAKAVAKAATISRANAKAAKAPAAKPPKAASAKGAKPTAPKPAVPKAPAIKKVARSKPVAMTQADLLRALLDDFDDDRARLVYADALQEQGDPRGEYIALSLVKGRDAAKRAKELLDAHRQKTWQNFGAKGARYTWRRGFICEVGAAAKELAAAGPLMFEVEPIDSISIYGDGQGHVGKLVGFPLRVRHLSLSLSRPEDAEAMAKATTLGNLRNLQLSSFGDRIAKLLAPSTAMPKLTSFSASLGGLTNAGLAALAKGPLLASVTDLTLHQNSLDADAMSTLVSAPWAKQLTNLGLSENPIRDEGVAALASSRNLSNLRQLSIANNWREQDHPTLGSGAADALVAAATTTFKNLESIDLSWNITGEPLARVKAAYGERLKMRVERFD
jgi:uncharacterized protein (TIGR02996 family)